MENGAGAPLPIPPLYGDFSLNAANVVTARRLLQEGLGRLAPTHDLSAEQLMALAEGLGEGALRREGACQDAGRLQGGLHVACV